MNNHDIKYYPQTECLMCGNWVLAKGIKHLFFKRLKDSWNVLIGKAEALYFNCPHLK